MSFALEQLRSAVAEHGTVIRVVIAQVDGSAPREVGASMLVWPNGQSGTIGGGALEWQAAETARDRLENSRPFKERIPLGPSLGQCCGGAVTLVYEVFDIACVKNLNGPNFARRVEGNSDCPLSITRCQAKTRNGQADVALQFTQGWLLEKVSKPTRHLWLYGAGHVGRAIVDVVSKLDDFEITWVDTADVRFPSEVPNHVTKLIAADQSSVVRYAPADAQHLVLTYSHEMDLQICHQILQSDFGDAGLIGSASKWARFRKRLAGLGHGEAQINRILCPIGDPTLGKQPHAIAIGVAAQLISGDLAQSKLQGRVA